MDQRLKVIDSWPDLISGIYSSVIFRPAVSPVGGKPCSTGHLKCQRGPPRGTPPFSDLVLSSPTARIRAAGLMIKKAPFVRPARRRVIAEPHACPHRA